MPDSIRFLGAAVSVMISLIIVTLSFELVFGYFTIALP